MGFFKFAYQCFDFFAWPLLALGYPLYASIRAIETDGNLNARKLVTYWVHFSLISLFEHAFPKLLELITLWPYIRLMIICWLVIPDFNGAHYVYRHVLHPCLSMDPNILIHWFGKWKDFILKKDDFLAEMESFVEKKDKGEYKIRADAEGYVKENGSESLEKLIDTKPLLHSKSIKSCNAVKEIKASAIKIEEGGETNVVHKDIKAVEVKEKREVAPAKEINQVEPVLAQETEKKTFSPIEIKETKEATVTRDRELPQIAAPDQVQKEWTCAICLVRTQSEITLKSHLQGRRHKAKCEDLKAKMSQNCKNQTNPPSFTKKSNHIPKENPEKPLPGNRTPRKSTRDDEAKETDMPKEELKKCVSRKSSTQGAKIDVSKDETDKCENSNGKTCRRGRRKAAKESNWLLPDDKPGKCVINNQADRKIDRTLKWWCGICNAKCTRADDLNSHLGGKRHLARIQELYGSTFGVPEVSLVV